MRSHYFLFLFFILSCFHSPFSVSLFSLPLCLLFLPPQTLLSSSQTHHQSTRAQLPQTHRRRRSVADLTHFGLSSLFSAFRLCVLSCACVLALCFELCLYFGFVFQARGCAPASWIEAAFRGSKCLLVDRSGYCSWLCLLVDRSGFRHTNIVVSAYRVGGFRRTGVVGFNFGLLWVCFVVAVDLYYFIVGDILFYCDVYIILLC